MGAYFLIVSQGKKVMSEKYIVKSFMMSYWEYKYV